jgi:CRP/FNR family transcriptional regulator, cyclic AMP receptor protein
MGGRALPGTSERGGPDDGARMRAILGPCRVLRSATDATLDALARARASTLRVYAAEEFVFRAGSPSDGMYVVADGLIAARLVTPGGAIVDVTAAGPGELIGYLELFDGAVRDVDGVALRRSTLAVVPFGAARAAIGTGAGLVTALATDLVAIVREFDATTLRRTFSPLPARLATLLLDLAREDLTDGSEPRPGWRLVLLGGPQTQLAQRLGVARQTLNRSLPDLAGRGLLELRPGGRSVVIDMVRLAAFARDHAANPRTSGPPSAVPDVRGVD